MLKELHLKVLDRLLDPDNRSIPIATRQGCLALGLGVCIVVNSYVKHGFKWPAERKQK